MIFLMVTEEKIENHILDFVMLYKFDALFHVDIFSVAFGKFRLSNARDCVNQEIFLQNLN